MVRKEESSNSWFYEVNLEIFFLETTLVWLNKKNVFGTGDFSVFYQLLCKGCVEALEVFCKVGIGDRYFSG